MQKNKQKNQEGITLLITILLMGVLLSIGSALLNVTLKQFQLAGIMLDSEMAFQAANAAMDCAKYFDPPGATKFAIPQSGTNENPVSITCMGVSMPDEAGGREGEFEDSENTSDDPGLTNKVDVQGEVQKFTFNWGVGNQSLCSQIIMRKYNAATTDVTYSLPGIFNGSRVCERTSNACTVVQARGYNVGCEEIDDGGRVVEREFTLVY